MEQIKLNFSSPEFDPTKPIIINGQEWILKTLDANEFNGNDRINHFLVQALRQLTESEMRILGQELMNRTRPIPTW